MIWVPVLPKGDDDRVQQKVAAPIHPDGYVWWASDSPPTTTQLPRSPPSASASAAESEHKTIHPNYEREGQAMTNIDHLLDRNRAFAGTDVRRDVPALPLLPRQGLHLRVGSLAVEVWVPEPCRRMRPGRIRGA
jgi:hypothetical protein